MPANNSTERQYGQYDNFLLSRLSNEDFLAIQPRLELTRLSLKEVVYKHGMPIQHVYFPCTCTLSVLTFMQNGTAVEVASIGNEGFSGIDLIMGADVASHTCICQIAGYSFRIRVSDFREMLGVNPTLRNITQRFLHVYVNHMSQSVACNRLHTVEERFARWLLIAHDRAGMESFYLTQEFMAEMLGVHRPTVSMAAGAFQQAGVIRYMRGHMTILDRPALEKAACECYDAVVSRFNRLLGLKRG